LAQNKLLTRQIEALTETLSKLPQQLQAVSSLHSSILQVKGCPTCGGTHELGQCVSEQDSSREVNYMGIPNRHGFQGYNQGNSSKFHQGATGFNHGPPRFNQGRNFTQGSGWRGIKEINIRSKGTNHHTNRHTSTLAKVRICKKSPPT